MNEGSRNGERGVGSGERSNVQTRQRSNATRGNPKFEISVTLL